MEITPRTLIPVAIAALVPVWAYAMLVNGGLVVALASTVSVFVIAWTLYAVFGPHEEGLVDRTGADTR